MNFYDVAYVLEIMIMSMKKMEKATKIGIQTQWSSWLKKNQNRMKI
jgi:hypothetical protein